MGMEVDGIPLGEDFKGYVFKISGGNDKQGFPMKQGILKNTRVRLLFSKGMNCYRERRKGMRKRKSVRGCIVGHDLAILNLVLVRQGETAIEGLTDGTSVRRLGPKRASKIRKMYDLEKTDDVRKFVVRRVVTGAEDKVKSKKAPKIQRLVTKITLQRKRFRSRNIIKNVEESRKNRKAYADRLHQYRQEQKEKRHAEVAKKKKKTQTTPAVKKGNAK